MNRKHVNHQPHHGQVEGQAFRVFWFFMALKFPMIFFPG